ncbi:hypothetical protein BJX61DRAFT_550158 [Aspergillus egyptiacus]|nr:hypothetical protein BJX61DRAFT_550158 [Aspergillus egyptiacus]
MPSDFRVIIVGGSIAGLTLSHCLNAAGIDNVVLEKHGEITSHVGASIGVLPNGARILDQLGLFYKVEKLIEPLTTAHIAYPDGFVLSSDFPVTVKERFGRPMAFLSRQELIQVLHSSFDDASHVHVNQRVTKVEQGTDRIRVITDNGTSWEGDLVVGADGIHSKVRSEMFSFDNSPHLARIALREHKELTVEYSCIFGMSSAVTGLEVGEQVACFHDGLTIMSYQGLGGRVYWFVVEKLDRKYTYPHLPRYSTQDAISGCERLGNVWLKGNIHFRHIWESRETFAMTPLEEGVIRAWHSGRIVCIGDSIHKMTVNLGQGANLAIEDAAQLSNLLYEMLSKKPNTKPTGEEIHTLLETFQRTHLRRATHVSMMSALMARLQARQGLLLTVLVRYVPLLFPNLPAELVSAVVHDSPFLKFLPLPAREGKGWPTVARAKACGVAMIISLAVVLVSMWLRAFFVVPSFEPLQTQINTTLF